MKNKKMILIVGLLLVLLGGGLVSSMGQAAETGAKGEKELKIGILQTTSHPALDEITEGVKDGLEEHGYVEGEGVTIDFQNGQGDQNLMNTMAQNLVDSGVDLLVGIGTPASQALANATSEIPIILGAVSDPVGAGLVESEEAPGGNITGVKDQSPVEAQLALMLELLPDTRHIGLFYSSGEDNAHAEAERAKEAAEALGLTTTTYTASGTNDVQQMVGLMAQEVDAIYLPTDNTIASAFDTVVKEATRYHTPLVPTVDAMINQGGLVTVGINQRLLGFESGRMGAEVLDGKDISTLPVYVFSEGDGLINKKQADELGIEISEIVLEQATLVETNE